MRGGSQPECSRIVDVRAENGVRKPARAFHNAWGDRRTSQPWPTEVVAHLADDPLVWPRVLDWEEELAAEPGMLDGGTHILFAVERT